MPFLRCAIVVATISLTPLLSAAQQPQSDASTPANAWMRVPVPDASPTDTTPASIRAERDKFWDELIGQRSPLTPETVSRVNSSGDFGPDALRQPEIPKFRDRVLAIARVQGYSTFLSHSQRSIYTEMSLQVERVFGAGNAPVSEKPVITVPIAGGTVRLPDGRAMSFLTDPREFSLKVGNTYFLALQYEKALDCYALRGDWDLSNGVVVANTYLDTLRAKRGLSALVGLTRQQLESWLAKHDY